MTYFPLPPSLLATAPLEGVTIPPSYKSPTSDAPPPAYFPPSRSPSPQPPVYKSPGRPNHDTNSHWARFPSSNPPKPSPHTPLSPSHPPPETEPRHTPSTSRAPPIYLAGKLNPAPKKHRHRHSLGYKPAFHTNERNHAHFSTSRPPPFSSSPYRLRSPSPCPPTHSRIVLNIGVETELDTEAERRHQCISSAKHQYNILADESDLALEERGRYGMCRERYGDRGRTGRGAMVAWCSLLVISMAVVVVVVAVLR